MITIKNQTIHELIVNVEASTFTVNPPLDIHQGDTRSHVMLIKLRNNEDFISLDKDIEYKMFYYLTKDKKLIETSDVTVVNYYRGVLSHIVSNKVVENFGSYTCYLRGYLGEEIVSTVSFPIVISKTHDYKAKSNEVIITKEFYDELKKHLKDTEIHLNEADRDFLDTFNDQIEELSQVIERDKKIKDYYNSQITPFTDIPEGLSILTGDMVFSEKDGTTHVVNSPANINHKVENDIHYISIVSNNDVIVYREDNEEFKFSSILYGGSGGDGWQNLIVNDPELITDDTKIWYDDKEHNTVEVYTSEESDAKFAPKSIIVTDRKDITNETEVFNDINQEDRIVEVYTSEEVDEKVEDINSQISSLELEVQSKQDAGDYATLLDLSNEVTARQSADNNLQEQIDAISVSSDVVDVVASYQELENYDTSHIKANDIVKVLEDETHDDAISYYRWIVPQSGDSYWSYIGSQGPFYTKAEADAEFKLEAGSGIEINNSKQIVNTLPGFMEYEWNLRQGKSYLAPSEFAEDILNKYGVSKGWVKVIRGGSFGTGDLNFVTVSANDIITYESYPLNRDTTYRVVVGRIIQSANGLITDFSNYGTDVTEKLSWEILNTLDVYNASSSRPLSCSGLATVLQQYASTSALENKLDKNQGSANKGKALVVGDTGLVTPQEIQSAYYFEFDLSVNSSGQVIATPREGVTFSAISDALSETKNVYLLVHYGNEVFVLLVDDISSSIISASSVIRASINSVIAFYVVRLKIDSTNTTDTMISPLQELLTIDDLLSDNSENPVQNKIVKSNIDKKVNIAQGAGNSGKVLGINAQGNVEPIIVQSGIEVIEI